MRRPLREPLLTRAARVSLAPLLAAAMGCQGGDRTSTSGPHGTSARDDAGATDARRPAIDTLTLAELRLDLARRFPALTRAGAGEAARADYVVAADGRVASARLVVGTPEALTDARPHRSGPAEAVGERARLEVRAFPAGELARVPVEVRWLRHGAGAAVPRTASVDADRDAVRAVLRERFGSELARARGTTRGYWVRTVAGRGVVGAGALAGGQQLSAGRITTHAFAAGDLAADPVRVVHLTDPR